MEWFAKPFMMLGDFWGLTLLSAVVGVLILVLVGLSTPQSLVEKARNKMASAIYEIRLYLDSPKRIILSQGRLIASSFGYVLAMLPAFLLMSIPIWILYLQLEPRLGMDPLEIGEQAVLSVHTGDANAGSTVELLPSDSFEVGGKVENSAGETHFQIMPKAAGLHVLEVKTSLGTLAKKIAVGKGHMVYPDRSSGSHYWGEAWGTEKRLIPKADGASQISIGHPASSRRFLGMPWWIYSLIVMTLAAFGLKDKLGITL